jgi:hypothetical protein
VSVKRAIKALRTAARPVSSSAVAAFCGVTYALAHIASRSAVRIAGI